MCQVFFIESSVNGNLGSFHALAAKNLGLHLFLDHFVSSKSVSDFATQRTVCSEPIPLYTTDD